MKRLIFFLLASIPLLATAQAVYTPNQHILSSTATGYSNATPADGRSMFYDNTLFKYRDFASTDEVLSYLNGTPAPNTARRKRFGHTPYFVHFGGTLVSGEWVGGTMKPYWFRDCLEDSCLIEMLPSEVAATWGSITGTLSSQTDLQSALNAKQAALVSGLNIKTINGTSVLGSGDIVVSGGGSADSTIFPTGFRLDTAKTNIRGEIAGVAAGAVDTNVYATRAWAETTFPYFFNVKSYGAKGDGKYLYDIRTTNGSATVTSASAGFTAADTGKRFFIRFGGVGGLDFFSHIVTVNSSTSVTLAHTLSATLTGYPTLGYGNYGTDDGPAIVAATLDAQDHNGTVWFPLTDNGSGVYIIASPLVTDDGQGVNPNAQIYLKAKHNTNQTRGRVKFLGESAPNFAVSSIHTIYDIPHPHSGVWLSSHLANPTGYMPAVIGTRGFADAAFPNVNYGLFMSVENVNIAVPSNPTGVGVAMSAINGFYSASTDVKNCLITVENSVSQQVEPQGHHAGIILNRFLTETAGVLDHAHVWGYRHGAIVSDHTDLRAYNAFCNVNGLTVTQSCSRVTGSMVANWNKYAIHAPAYSLFDLSPGMASVNIDLTSERWTTPGYFYSTVATIDDGGNYLRGKIEVDPQSSGVAFDEDALIKQGGRNVMVARSSTGYFPEWAEGQWPTTRRGGQFAYNTTTGMMQWYNGVTQSFMNAGGGGSTDTAGMGLATRNQLRDTATAIRSDMAEKPYLVHADTAWDGSPIYRTLTANLSLALNTSKINGVGYFKQDGTGAHTLTLDSVAIPIAAGANKWSSVSFSLVNGLYIFKADTALYASTAPVPLPIPAAPTGGTVNDATDQFGFTPSSGYTSTAHEWSKDSGSVWANVTANPIYVGNVDVPIGHLRVRVKANTGVNQTGLSLANATAFTDTVVISTAYDAVYAVKTANVTQVNTTEWHLEPISTNPGAQAFGTDTTHKILPGTDVLYYADMASVNNHGVVLGFDTLLYSTATDTSGSTLSRFMFAAYGSNTYMGGQEYNSNISSDFSGLDFFSFGYSSNNKFGLRIRDAATTPVVEAVYSTNGGSTWTVAHTFSYTVPAGKTLYPRLGYIQTTRICLNPKLEY